MQAGLADARTSFATIGTAVPFDGATLVPDCVVERPGRAAGDDRESLASGGVERTYILHVQPSYDGVRRLPLVLNFHGFGSNAEQQARYSRLPAKADEAGFILVTPDGVNNMWNITATGDDNPDIAFVRDLLAKLQAELCIDENRIYATGMSNGSAFSQRLACALPVIRAVGAVAAVSTPRDCARPVPVVFFHGTEDVCVPYDGGPLTCGLLRVSIPPIPDMVAGWARHNGCDEPPLEATAAEHVRTSTYAGCDAGADVVLYTVEGGGHTWPGSAGPARLGPSTNEIDATDLIWEFFAAR